MEQINFSECKAVCLRLLKNGEPLAILHPAPGRSRKGGFGAMRSTLRGPVDDLIQPVDGVEWDALRSPMIA